MSPAGGADTRVCRAETHLGALQRLDTIVEAADTSGSRSLAGTSLAPETRPDLTGLRHWN